VAEKLDPNNQRRDDKRILPRYRRKNKDEAKPHRELNNHTNGTWEHQSIIKTIPN